MGRTACTEPQCLYKGALYLYLTVELYLYSPYGPHDLYRASVPVQACTLPLPYSRAIPLLPLWAVRPEQSLSACTRVHFTLPCENIIWIEKKIRSWIEWYFMETKTEVAKHVLKCSKPPCYVNIASEFLSRSFKGWCFLFYILLWIFCFVHHLLDFICQKHCYSTWHLSLYMKT